MDSTPEKLQPSETQVETKPEALSPQGRAAMQGFSENPPAPTAQEAGGDWVNRGIIDVPVADLPMPEGVSSPQDFDHHISWDDAANATRQLPQIQKEVKDGKTGDDFDAEDQAAGLSYPNGKKAVYDLYYGGDPVQVDKDGDQYTINSGRHRIYAAKALGLETIPALVMEKKS